MDNRAIPLKTTAVRFSKTISRFARSEAGGRAKLRFAALVLLLCAASALSVVNSYVGRNFMTAIANRDMAGFTRQALFYVAVFAASTVVTVLARFGEDRLALLWRETLTRQAVLAYVARGAYHRLETTGAVANPDQRISEDVRAFTVTALSFVVMAFNSALTIFAFSGVLWTISPLLFVVAVAYAACGSVVTLILSRPLVKLNSDQLDKEASFRSGLIHVRGQADTVRREREDATQASLLLGRLDDLVANFRKLTAVNRNVSFFTTGYNWMIQIIPALIIAPAFVAGKIEFGVITQSAMVFSTLVAAFSLIVTQYQSLSSFAAVVERLSALADFLGDPMEAGAESAKG